MKYRISQKETKENFTRVFKVGYCEIKDIEYFLSPEAYNSGIYGWNYDLFAFGLYAITTGYRPIGEYTDEHFIKTINDIAYDCQRKYINNKKFRECQDECKNKIYNFLSNYTGVQL